MDHRIHQLPHQHALNVTAPVRQSSSKSNVNFKDVLTEQTGLKISKHASERLQERNIEIDTKQWEQINDKVKEAKAKGITDSLVITEQAALLVSAKNNTVVTAMNRQEATSRIFTNINGTILMDK
ncbi:flagellar operon protein [Oceanobacillus picturae]|uniref:Flagellar operon protein n=1 Tax=Oceanobacillus picturae TaxID=171693 RepID=W9A8Z6_9BACI|nr:TIGR02530 family flagellar biosynthesis protein [Oceanobacillus picturae]RIU96363.1 flagellar protein [Oceanobacillus picturae]CDO02229.1 flagellar operon protein [Oceanobacillus picturae]